MTTCPLGFWIQGAANEERRLITWAAAFGSYAACDGRAEVESEAYLSAFTFDTKFSERADAYDRLDVCDYRGTCAAPFIWFDLDRNLLDDALRDARRLASILDERFGLPDDGLLIFFSGSKGFHLGLPTALWSPEPSVDFNKTARQFAESLAAAASVVIDTGVYDKVRAFRAPNSRHPKTGRYKRRLSFDELLNLSVEGITKLAEVPEPFEVPTTTGRCEQAVADWATAVEQVRRQAEAVAERRASVDGATLNRETLDFIREGALEGDRANRLFSAAANIAEFDDLASLAVALLTEAGLDSGLPPKEVRRQIDCGLAAGGRHE